MAPDYSAQVRIRLEVGDRQNVLSHAAKSFVIAKDAEELPPCEATVVFTVDGERTDRRVRLLDGMSASVRKTEVLSLRALAQEIR